MQHHLARAPHRKARRCIRAIALAAHSCSTLVWAPDRAIFSSAGGGTQFDRPRFLILARQSPIRQTPVSTLVTNTCDGYGNIPEGVLCTCTVLRVTRGTLAVPYKWLPSSSVFVKPPLHPLHACQPSLPVAALAES